jgi:hypothetical protein
MSIRRSLLLTTALTPALLLTGIAPSAAQSGLPAVAYPNAVIGGEGGTWFDQAFGLGEARFATPLSHSFGAQLDGIVGTVGGATYGQVSGHLFWRDPSAGLLGLYGAWVYQGGMSSGRVGPEAEVYLDNVTLSTVAGAAFGNGTTNAFAHGKVSLYLTPNHKLYGGYAYEGPGTGEGIVGLEAFFPGPHISGFVEGRFGSHETAAMAGLRFFSAGSGKDLKDRERQDIAPLWKHVAEQTVETTEAPTTPPRSTTTTTTTTPAPTTFPPTTPPTTLI